MISECVSCTKKFPSKDLHPIEIWDDLDLVEITKPRIVKLCYRCLEELDALTEGH